MFLPLCLAIGLSLVLLICLLLRLVSPESLCVSATGTPVISRRNFGMEIWGTWSAPWCRQNPEGSCSQLFFWFLGPDGSVWVPLVPGIWAEVEFLPVLIGVMILLGDQLSPHRIWYGALWESISSGCKWRKERSCLRLLFSSFDLIALCMSFWAVVVVLPVLTGLSAHLRDSITAVFGYGEPRHRINRHI